MESSSSSASPAGATRISRRGSPRAAALASLGEVRAGVGVPLTPMTYASLLEARGWERFDAEARAAGATSLIVADLPAGEHPELKRAQLGSPTSPAERRRGPGGR